MPPHLRLPRRLLVLLGAGLLGGCQAMLFGGLNLSAHRDGVQVVRDVAFDPTHGLALDVYRPLHARNAPVVVFFYGGSWKSGRRQWYRWVGQALAHRGLVVVIPDYRKWPQVKLEGFMRDAARAVAWTRSHASDYGGNPHALFVMGHSAGAHIAALLATDARWLAAEGLHPRDLAGMIGLAGPYDFLPLTDATFIDMFGHTHAEQLRSQPVHFVDGDEPPMLLLQGEADNTVEPRNARSLAAALRGQGEPVTMKMYPGIGHVGILMALSRPFRGKAPALADVLQFVQSRQGAALPERSLSH